MWGRKDGHLRFLILSISILVVLSGCLEGPGEDDDGSIITHFDYGKYPSDMSWKPDGYYSLICGQAG